MTAPKPDRPWDFSKVLELINTLDAKHPSPPASKPADYALLGSHSLPNDSHLRPVNIAVQGEGGGVGLGDFGKIWEFLGAPSDSSAPKVPANNVVSFAEPEQTSPTLQQRVPTKADYTSDGAVYLTPSKKASKGIQWRDEASGAELTDVAPTNRDGDDDDDDDEKLTKTQRKKKRRQERRRLQAENPQRAVSDFESDDDQHGGRATPASKASAHNVISDPSKTDSRYTLRPRDSTGNAITTSKDKTAPSSTPVKPVKSAAAFFEKRDRSRSPTKQSQSFQKQPPQGTPSTPKPSFLTKGIRQQSQPLTATNKTPATDTKENLKSQWPITTPANAKKLSLLPSTVQPIRNPTTPIFPTRTQSGVPETLHDTPTKINRHVIKPKTVRTGEDRNWALLLKLVSDFYEDRKHLIAPANLTNHSNNPTGIHVFVDASNIFIGFHDQLKRARGIPQHYHVPRVDLSFDALALLMERRRPVAKRVLVGSKPRLPAFDTAQGIGYECNLLDKVLKARELTERQKYFKEQEKRRFGRRSGSVSAGDSGGSGSEMTGGPAFAKEAYVEQGVDEIIHLKMMESLVDTKEPGTMVLATGDAAQAEYSQGFMKMAERALKAGWRIELVSWSQNISQAYKRAAFRKEWGDHFRIIELDDYAEELLDM